MRRSIIAFLIALFALPCAASGLFSYERYYLFELVADADVVVTGEIVELEKKTFALRVEEWVVGQGADRIEVHRFVDWTCAGRWTPYALGQRVMLFARLPMSVGAPYRVLGSGGEGELSIEGQDVFARGFLVHGYEPEVLAVGDRSIAGTRIPAQEWFEAVRGFRRVFAWRRADPKPSRTRLNYVVDLGHRGDPEATEAYASSSTSARHLVEQAYTSNIWPRVREVVSPRIEDLPGFDAEEIEPTKVTNRYLPVSRMLFGEACAVVGDLDGDGNPEYAAAVHSVARGGWNKGSAWILFSDGAGGIAKMTDLGAATVGAGPEPESVHGFGASLAPLGDVNGDGVPDLAVGAHGGLVRGEATGAVWVLFMNPDGSVLRSEELICREPIQRALLVDGELSTSLIYGGALATLGDLDGDGLPELLLGGRSHTFFGVVPKTELIVSLDREGGVRWARGLGRADGFSSLRGFSKSYVGLGDLDGDGIPDLAIGDSGNAEGGEGRGGVWIVFLNADGSFREERLISDWSGDFGGLLLDDDRFGLALAAPGDLTGDDVPDLLVTSTEGIWFLELGRDARVVSETLAFGTTENHSLASIACGVPIALTGAASSEPSDERAALARGPAPLLAGGFGRGSLRCLSLARVLSVALPEKVR